MTKAKKKNQVKIPLRGNLVEVQVGDRKVKGVSAEYVIEKEDWSVYRLKNGSSVKIRVVVEDIIVTGEEASPGVPLIVVKQGVIVSYTPAPTKGSKAKAKNK